MIELKVICDCGQKYKFDVEPVNGQMPFTVNCPVCGADGTSKANLLLQQRALAPTPATVISYTPPPAPVIAPAPIPTIAPAPAPAPIIASAAAAPVIAPVPAQAAGGGVAPPAIGGPKLRINIPAAHSAPAGAPPPLSAPGAIAPPPLGGRPIGRPLAPLAAAAGEPAKKGNFWMGMAGGAAGSLIGGAIYYFLLTIFGRSEGLGSLVALAFVWLGSPLLTIGVAYLAGAGAAYLGKEEGSKELGAIVAIFALAGIITAQYFAAWTWWDRAKNFGNDAAYSVSVDEAKEVVAAVPTGSDSEIRGYLAKEAMDDEDNANNASNSITADQIKQFREERLPEYQGLASGQITKAQFLAKTESETKKLFKSQKQGQDDESSSDDSSDEGTFKAIFLAFLLRKSNIFMLIASAGLAYKISSNA